VTNATETPLEINWIPMREHSVALEGTDVIVFRANGDVSVEDVEEFIRIASAWPIPEGGFFYLSDITKLGHQSQQSMHRLRTLPPNFIRASAVVGASFRNRVVLEIMLRAGRAIGLAISQELPRIVGSYDEARAVFAKHRNGKP
jgi:hypothetical protein